MAKLSKTAVAKKEDAKNKLEDQIADFKKQIHDLRKSDESRLAKTHKLKHYQQQIAKLQRKLTDI